MTPFFDISRGLTGVSPVLKYKMLKNYLLEYIWIDAYNSLRSKQRL